MHKHIPRSAVLVAGLICCLTLLGTPVNASSVQIVLDFETRADGTPYTGDPQDFFASEEYEPFGALFFSSIGSGFIGVDLTNPANVGTFISGYYAEVGSFGESNFLEVVFTAEAAEISFDFAAPDGVIDVSLFDQDDNLVLQQTIVGTEEFLNLAGFTQFAGSAELAAESVRRMLIEPCSFCSLSAFDNFQYTLSIVPVPPSVILLLSGVALLFGSKKR